MVKITLSFDSSWVLSKRGEAVLPVGAFVAAMKELYRVDVIDSSLTDCELIVKNVDVEAAEVTCRVQEVLTDKLGMTPGAPQAKYSVVPYAPNEFDGGEAAETKPAEEPAAEEPNARLNRLCETIDALVGADEFKALAHECIAVAPGLIKHRLTEAFTRQSYIFAVNDGYGMTTYLKLFADLLGELRLIEADQEPHIVETRLLPPQDRSDVDPFADARNQMRRCSQKGLCLLCIDIREWMSKTRDKAFREFLTTLEDRSEKTVVIFRVPFVEREILNGLAQSIGDILSVRAVSFVPFDHDELLTYAREAVAKRGFTAEEEVWDVFRARLTEEKNDGRFYGINTVDKVVLDMLYRKHVHNAQNAVDDTVIKKDEILSLAPSYSEEHRTGVELLDGFIGMETIKQRVDEIVAQIEMAAKNDKLGSPCIHMRFVGNPGTGKTTVARVIGRILKEKGILRNGSFFEYAGRDFCGRYIGETAPKTAAMCRDAYGSVLFIDEAYSLYRGEGGSKADYGREAIDTLIAEMENHRNDLVVIMAGYPDEMNELMKANAGLESRMPYVLEFPNYTREQLFDIFMLMTRKSFTYKDGFEEAVRGYFDTLPDELLQSKEFSNARFVRNLFERTWAKAMMRAQMNREDASVLTREDFLLASSEKEFSKIMKKQPRALGFV